MKYLLFLLFSISPYLLYSQNNTKNNVLTEKNGFREIKLGSNIKIYPYIYKSKSSNDFYTYVNGGLRDFGIYDVNYFVDTKMANFDKIGNTKILKAFVASHNDSIYKIVIITDYSKSVFDNLKIMFGDDLTGIGYTNDSKKIMGFWSGDDVFLSVTSGPFESPDFLTIVYTKNSIENVVKKEADLKYQKFKIEQNEKIKKDF